MTRLLESENNKRIINNLLKHSHLYIYNTCACKTLWLVLVVRILFGVVFVYSNITIILSKDVYPSRCEPLFFQKRDVFPFRCESLLCLKVSLLSMQDISSTIKFKIISKRVNSLYFLLLISWIDNRETVKHNKDSHRNGNTSRLLKEQRFTSERIHIATFERMFVILE